MRKADRWTTRPPSRGGATARPARRGFTLMESLMAAGLLFGVVVSVTGAIIAGQQHALEAQQKIAATLAAEDLMGRLIDASYDQLPAWHGYTEDVGTMTDIDGKPLPDSFRSLGRQVSVTTTLYQLEDIEVNIRGREVTVRAFDTHGRKLARLTRFVPEPAEDSLLPEG